jgi:hypothetical protein
MYRFYTLVFNSSRVNYFNPWFGSQIPVNAIEYGGRIINVQFADFDNNSLDNFV